MIGQYYHILDDIFSSTPPPLDDVVVVDDAFDFDMDKDCLPTTDALDVDGKDASSEWCSDDGEDDWEGWWCLGATICWPKRCASFPTKYL